MQTYADRMGEVNMVQSDGGVKRKANRLNMTTYRLCCMDELSPTSKHTRLEESPPDKLVPLFKITVLKGFFVAVQRPILVP